ncbi:RodZ domain-containing protein [Halomonas sp. NPDC076908]|uniref:RodZ domain-containing protein n=1 Tax=Halomonas sp. NPDC076908 TaxID=3390567 RepID=UPI003D01C89A
MSDTQSQENVINSTSDTVHASTSPGELLLRQREQLGVPLADAARALNLRPAVIGGLERDDYQEIPVAAYRRGYLRAYAKYLGMDDHLVLEAYQARNGTIDTERKVTPVSTASRPPSKIGAWLFKLVTLLVIVGLIAVTVMWWQSRGGNEPPGFSSSPTEETTPPPALPANDEPAAGADDSPSPGFTSGGENTALISDAVNISPTPTTSEEPMTGEDGTDLASAPDSPAPTDTADEPQTAAVEDETTTSDDAEQSVNVNTLELTFNEQSWTEIFDATNQRVFVGLQTPGTTTTVEGEPPFRLTVGNATGVELRYQGEEVDLPARAGANNVARFTLGE